MNDNLRSMNVDIFQATNYLISLFYRTENRYSTSRIKISKLMSIVAFIYARWGIKLFQEDIFRYDNCGTIIPKLNRLPKDICSMNFNNDTKKYISDDLFVDYEMPAGYSIFKDVPEDVKLVIEDVFRHFGAYSQVDLGDCLNKIVYLEGFVDSDDIIILEELKDLEMYNFKNDENMDIINYLIK